MGSCLSSTSPPPPSSSCSYSSTTTTTTRTAKVVTMKGDVVEYKVPVYAYEVVEAASSFFLCNSDSLLFDEYVPAMELEEDLEVDQIYFLLPKTQIQYKLSASDVAALAVKASVALQNHQTTNTGSCKKGNGKGCSGSGSSSNMNHGHTRKMKGARISPLLAGGVNIDVESVATQHQQKQKPRLVSNTRSAGSSSSSSVRRLQRYTSRRAKLLAVRSFRRLRLATIYEGVVV